MTEIKRPLIILGAARSGTTLLGHLLARHPAVAYWEEPKHIWRAGHAYRRHDVRSAEDATPKVATYIRRAFGRFLSRTGKTHFAEKTPGNCFRVPFIAEIFPDAKFVHLIRDGRAVAASAAAQWTHDVVLRRNIDTDGQVFNSSYGAKTSGVSVVGRAADAVRAVRKFLVEKQRFAGGPRVWLEAPAYVPDLARVILRKLSGSDKSYLWGPRFPGMERVHSSYSLIETCAFQWAWSVQSALVHGRQLGADRYIEIRYESLIDDPETVLDDICSFAELPEWPTRGAVVGEMIRPSDHSTWRRHLSDEQAALLTAWLTPLLGELGYPIDGSSGVE